MRNCPSCGHNSPLNLGADGYENSKGDRLCCDCATQEAEQRYRHWAAADERGGIRDGIRDELRRRWWRRMPAYSDLCTYRIASVFDGVFDDRAWSHISDNIAPGVDLGAARDSDGPDPDPDAVSGDAPDPGGPAPDITDDQADDQADDDASTGTKDDFASFLAEIGIGCGGDAPRLSRALGVGAKHLSEHIADKHLRDPERAERATGCKIALVPENTTSLRFEIAYFTKQQQGNPGKRPTFSWVHPRARYGAPYGSDESAPTVSAQVLGYIEQHRAEYDCLMETCANVSHPDDAAAEVDESDFTPARIGEAIGREPRAVQRSRAYLQRIRPARRGEMPPG